MLTNKTKTKKKTKNKKKNYNSTCNHYSHKTIQGILKLASLSSSTRTYHNFSTKKSSAPGSLNPTKELFPLKSLQLQQASTLPRNSSPPPPPEDAAPEPLKSLCTTLTIYPGSTPTQTNTSNNINISTFLDETKTMILIQCPFNHGYNSHTHSQ